MVTRLLAGFGLDLRVVAAAEPIRGSYWGESEAGPARQRLFARLDTPLHSILHEAAHYVCMSPERRAGLDRDAGGDDAEESAVCYLQFLLADTLARGTARAQLRRHGPVGLQLSARQHRAWFEQDADDARLVAAGTRGYR